MIEALLSWNFLILFFVDSEPLKKLGFVGHMYYEVDQLEGRYEEYSWNWMHVQFLWRKCGRIFFFVWYRPLKLTCQSSNDRSASAWVTIAKLACVPGVC